MVLSLVGLHTEFHYNFQVLMGNFHLSGLSTTYLLISRYFKVYPDLDNLSAYIRIIFKCPKLRATFT